MKQRKEFNPADWQEPQPSKQDAAKTKPSQTSDSSDKLDDIERLTQAIEARRVDITADYGRWRNIGFALVSAMGEYGRDYFHRISRFYPGYSEKDTDAQYDKCLRAKGTGITLASLFQYAKEDAGIIISPSHGGMAEVAELAEEGRRKNSDLLEEGTRENAKDYRGDCG